MKRRHAPAACPWRRLRGAEAWSGLRILRYNSLRMLSSSLDGALRRGRFDRPSTLVMVGDFRFDLECARAAGARSVLVNLAENPWPELADHFAVDCATLARDVGWR